MANELENMTSLPVPDPESEDSKLARIFGSESLQRSNSRTESGLSNLKASATIGQIGPRRDPPGTGGTLVQAFSDRLGPQSWQTDHAYCAGLNVARHALEEAKSKERRGPPPDLQIILFDARRHNSRALAKLHVTSWRSTYRGIMPDKVINSLNYQRFEEKWEQLLSQNDPDVLTFMALDPEHGLLGFIRAGSNGTEDAPAPNEIYALNIAPRFQRRGVGTLLMKEAFYQINKHAHWRVEAGIDAPEALCDSVFLWVLCANQKTRWFMKALGGRQARLGEDTVDKEKLPKVAYLWTDLSHVLESEFESQLHIQPSRH